MTARRHPISLLLLLGLFLPTALLAQPPGNRYYSIKAGLFEQNGQWSNSSHNANSSGINPGCIINGNVDIFIADSLESDCQPLIINGNANFQIKDGGNLIINGDLQISGNAAFEVEDNAALTVNGDLQVTGSGELELDGNLSVNGDVTVTGNGEVCGSGNASVSGSVSGEGWCLNVNTLPIDLVYFDAKSSKQNKQVRLEWTTATELNNDRFIVERSSNGLVFEQVTEVKGAGNSAADINYQFEDGPLEPGTYYYRLTQIDYNGIEAQFDVVVIQLEDEETEEPCDLKIYPNPCVPSCKAVLDCPGTMFRTFVMDGYGRQISQLIPVSKFNNETVYHIDSENFVMPGIYFIKATSETQEVTKKVMIK